VKENDMEMVTIIASVVAIVVGIFAIGLSLAFYKMSSRMMGNIIDASKELQTSIGRLETIFNRLYTGPISTTKESSPEAPRPPLPQTGEQEELVREEIEKRVEKKVEELKRALERGRGAISEKPMIQEARIDLVKKEIPGVMDRAMTEPGKAEAEAFKGSIRERIEKQIIYYQHRGYKGIISEFLFDDIKSDTPQLTPSDVEAELNKMKKESILDWEGDKLGPNTHIEFKK
jgi:hypothetical protein